MGAFNVVVNVMALAMVAPQRGPARAGRANLVMTGSAELEALQAACLAKLEANFALTRRDFADSLDCASWSSGAASGEVVGFAGEPKIGWVSSSVTTADGAVSAELTAWVAPTYDIPHLYQKLSIIANGKLSLTLDCIARYDVTSDPQYLSQYYLSTQEWQDGVRRSAPGVAESSAQQDVYMRTIRSPMQLALDLPDSAESLAAVATACAEATERWIGWWGGAKEVNRMKIGALFARDTKQHRMRFQSHAANLKAKGLPVELAECVAQAIVGPGGARRARPARRGSARPRAASAANAAPSAAHLPRAAPSPPTGSDRRAIRRPGELTVINVSP